MSLAQTLWPTPIWHPDRFEFEAGRLRFVRMDREAYRRSTFLDHRAALPDDRSFTVDLETLHASCSDMDEPANCAHFIFHHAFCGSTLLTRCLDAVGACLPLREPFALHQLSIRQERVANAPWEDALLPITLRLLSRTFAATQVPVIKPSDYVSARMTELLAVRPGSKALFLHTSLEEFVAQILKLEDRRKWVHTRMHPDFRRLVASIDGAARSHSDGEAAAALWFAQRHGYCSICHHHPNLRSLDFRRFLRDPVAVVEGLAHWFTIPLVPEELAAVPRCMERNAKRPSARYDRETHDRDIASILDRHRGEVARARRYVERLSARVPMPASLPQPLVSSRAPLASAGPE